VKVDKNWRNDVEKLKKYGYMVGNGARASNKYLEFDS
jgi:hypothetical protein